MAKLTKDEVQERIDYAVFLYARRLPKSQIKATLKEQFQLKARQAERYMAHARKVAVRVAGIKPEVALRKAINFYISVIGDPDAMIADKIKAQERLDKLYCHEQKVLKIIGDRNNPVHVSSALQIDPMSLIREVKQVINTGELIIEHAAIPDATATAPETAEGREDVHREASADGAEQAGSGG